MLHVPVASAAARSSDTVRVGARPEKITAGPRRRPATPDGSNVLRGTVVVAAFLGVSIQYVDRAAGGEELNVFTQNTEGAETGPGWPSAARSSSPGSPEHTFVVVDRD